MTRTIFNVLEVKKDTYKNLHRQNIKNLSQALTTKKYYWRRWDSKCQSIKSRSQRKDKRFSINRGLNCTREIACNHLNKIIFFRTYKKLILSLMQISLKLVFDRAYWYNKFVNYEGDTIKKPSLYKKQNHQNNSCD